MGAKSLRGSIQVLFFNSADASGMAALVSRRTSRAMKRSCILTSPRHRKRSLRSRCMHRDSQPPSVQVCTCDELKARHVVSFQGICGIYSAYPRPELHTELFTSTTMLPDKTDKRRFVERLVLVGAIRLPANIHVARPSQHQPGKPLDITIMGIQVQHGTQLHACIYFR